MPSCRWRFSCIAAVLTASKPDSEASPSVGICYNLVARSARRSLVRRTAIRSAESRRTRSHSVRGKSPSTRRARCASRRPSRRPARAGRRVDARRATRCREARQDRVCAEMARRRRPRRRTRKTARDRARRESRRVEASGLLVNSASERARAERVEHLGNARIGPRVHRADAARRSRGTARARRAVPRCRAPRTRARRASPRRRRPCGRCEPRAAAARRTRRAARSSRWPDRGASRSACRRDRRRTAEMRRLSAESRQLIGSADSRHARYSANDVGVSHTVTRTTGIPVRRLVEDQPGDRSTVGLLSSR